VGTVRSVQAVERRGDRFRIDGEGFKRQMIVLDN
jgi:hypothetical protein